MRKIKAVKSKDALGQARIYYLAYGANTNHTVMKSVCTDAELLGSVTLPAHRLVFKNHCDLVPDVTSSVQCVLWSVTQRCESLLDRMEGYPEYYSKKFIPVNLDGKSLRAMVYFMRDYQKESLPSQSYLDLVVQGYVENNLDCSPLRTAIINAYNQEKDSLKSL